MGSIAIFLGFMILIAVIGRFFNNPGRSASTKANTGDNYFYARKDSIMTSAEASFYHRLESVVTDKYYIFPQIHIASLMVNRTSGKYRKLGFQRINRASVDYVLCDKQSMQPVYAIELDDITHDTEKRIARDQWVNKAFADINLPLIRFRNVSSMTNDQIEQKFKDTAQFQT